MEDRMSTAPSAQGEALTSTPEEAETKILAATFYL